MTLLVEKGWLEGSAIRRARKSFTCRYWKGKSAGGSCRKPINPGDYYVDGESKGESTRNGILLQDKYCMECAGADAIASLPKCEAQ